MSSLKPFFEAVTGSRPLALYRIAVGSASFLRAYLQYQILRSLYSGDVITAKRFDWMPDLSMAWIAPFIAAWMLLSLMLAIGLYTRITGGLLFALLAYQLALDENLYANNLYLLMLSALLVIVADSGRSLSLDRVLFRNEPELVVRWSTLLPRLQISIVYFFSAFTKMTPNFLSGRVIQDSMRVPSALAGTWLPTAAAVVAVGTELFLSVALWIPKFRRAAFLLGLCLHGVILVGMQQQYTMAMLAFGTITLAPYMLFLEHRPNTRLVIWDDQCSCCHSWIRLLRSIDWLGIHRFERSGNPTMLAGHGISAKEADREIKLCFDGDILSGFAAVREMFAVMPVSFLWAPLLWIPPISSAGEWTYRSIATRRRCTHVASAVR